MGPQTVRTWVGCDPVRRCRWPQQAQRRGVFRDAVTAAPPPPLAGRCGGFCRQHGCNLTWGRRRVTPAPGRPSPACRSGPSRSCFPPGGYSSGRLSCAWGSACNRALIGGHPQIRAEPTGPRRVGRRPAARSPGPPLASPGVSDRRRLAGVCGAVATRAMASRGLWCWLDPRPIGPPPATILRRAGTFPARPERGSRVVGPPAASLRAGGHRPSAR